MDDSDHIRGRIERVKERGIGVEGTVLLGLDEHDEDYVKRMVDFLLDIDLDLAEFTILTPFPGTPIREQLEREGRILHNDWIHYTGGEVVFQPKQMSVEDAAGDVRIRLGSILCLLLEGTPNGEAVPQGAGDGEEGRNLQEGKAESKALLG